MAARIEFLSVFESFITSKIGNATCDANCTLTTNTMLDIYFKGVVSTFGD